MLLAMFQKGGGFAQVVAGAVLFVSVGWLLFKIPFVDRLMSGPMEGRYIGLKYLGFFGLVILIMLIAVVVPALLLGIPL
jgi:hypothetical protein